MQARRTKTKMVWLRGSSVRHQSSRAWSRFLVLVATCVLGVSACGSPTPGKASGVVTVTFYTCTERNFTETLYIHQGQSVIATPRVVTGIRYRFSLPVGHYIFSTSTHYAFATLATLGNAQRVDVYSGRSVHLNFPPNPCN